MKKYLKISGILLFAVFYGITIFFININSVNFNYGNNLNKDKADYFFSVSNNLFCNTPKTEDNTTNIGNSFCLIKNFNTINLIVKLKEKIYENSYTLYMYKSIKFILTLKSHSIAFPFKYFW